MTTSTNSVRHPLLHLMRQGARWVGQDGYPAFEHITDEHERWLEYVDAKAQLGRFLPRLRDRARQRDEALAEIAVAYFLERHASLPIVEWEPHGMERASSGCPCLMED